MEKSKPFRDMTDEELQVERKKWDDKVTNAKYWGAAVAAAHNFRTECDKEIERRKRPKVRPRVIIESPYSGDIERNVIYAERCLLDSLSRGEAPFASHLLYTRVLDDTDPIQRRWGMESGFSWHQVADISALYIDYGMSGGMTEGKKIAKSYGLTIEERIIGENP